MMGKKFVEIDRRRDELAVFEVALSSDVDRKKNRSVLNQGAGTGSDFPGFGLHRACVGLRIPYANYIKNIFAQLTSIGPCCFQSGQGLDLSSVGSVLSLGPFQLY